MRISAPVHLSGCCRSLEMSITKSIVATIILVLVIETTSLWGFLDFDFYFTLYKGRFVNALLELIFVVVFVILIGGFKSLVPAILEILCSCTYRRNCISIYPNRTKYGLLLRRQS